MSQVVAKPAAGHTAAHAPVVRARGWGRQPRPLASRRVVTRLAWFVVMLAFAAFFVVPLIWLLIAPTKTDHQLVFEGSLTFGSFHSFLHSWDALYSFQAHELLRWLENSAEYSAGGVLLALGCAVPAGYGLALTEFAGRKVLLSVTLLVMIMPFSALVLPLFLEMNLAHLDNTAWSVADSQRVSRIATVGARRNISELTLFEAVRSSVSLPEEVGKQDTHLLRLADQR